jgi:hypothetical protein
MALRFATLKKCAEVTCRQEVPDTKRVHLVGGLIVEIPICQEHFRQSYDAVARQQTSP